jgi:hypothetical protein
MQKCGEVEVQLPASLTSVPEGGEWSVSCPVCFNPGEGPVSWVSEPVWTLRKGTFRPRAGHEDP